MSEYMKKYYQEHKEYCKKRAHEYYLAHKDRHIECHKEWVKNNPLKIKSLRHKYFLKNKVEHQRLCHEYYIKHREEILKKAKEVLQ